MTTLDTTTGTGALKQPVENDKAIVVNQIILRSIDRSMKDIETWRNAHKAAESIWSPVRVRLYDLYSDVLLDGHLTGLIQKRFSAVLNKAIYFQTKEKDRVEEMDTLIKSLKFSDLMADILNTMLWGTSGMEFIIGKEFDWCEVPRKHIKPELKIISREQNGYEGFEYADMPLMWITGKTFDLGLLLKCCPYALWKRGGFADYAQFVEIFGQPIRIYKYDAFDIKTKNEIQTVANEAGAAMSLIIPKQAEFEMIDGKTANANGDLQTKFITTLNNELSVIILGNTETTTASTSSGYAQSKTHGEQQMEITQSDMKYLLQHLNSPKFLEILKSYGLPVEGGEFVFEQEVKVGELVERIKVDTAVSSIVPVADDYFYETYHIPKPDNYEALKAKMDEDKKLQAGIAAEDKSGNPKPADKSGKKPAKKKPEAKEPDDLIEGEGLTVWQLLRMKAADFFA